MEYVNLQGAWEVRLFGSDGREEGPFSIDLPSTTSFSGIGSENRECSPEHLTDRFAFEGTAIYSRRVHIPQGKAVCLLLERTRMTEVWVDRVCAGHADSLCTPHRYLLPETCRGDHVLEIKVTNTGYPTRGGHMTSADTQTNWNGITGNITLLAGKAVPQYLHAWAWPGKLHVEASFWGTEEGCAELKVDGRSVSTVQVQHGQLQADVRIPETLALWDDQTPNLHRLSVLFAGECFDVNIGIRRLAADGRRLLLNGREIFLRGKHDGMVFPLRGAAPTDYAAWYQVLSTAKAYGINHYRFHTCCPPENAFAAADVLGILMEPELPFWGTVPGTDAADEEKRENAYLTEEGRNILRAFGSHPSFVMFSMGNELWGDRETIGSMIKALRQVDPDKCYISGSNNFQFTPFVHPEEDICVGVRFGRDRLYRGSYAMCDAPLGRVQTTAPESFSAYDGAILSSEEESTKEETIQVQRGTESVEVAGNGGELRAVPVISHEVGQYAMYPDYAEIEKYTGPLAATNLVRMREIARSHGLLENAAAYFHASGKLAVDCYRREIETALRTRSLSGFQLLDLQDFPGQGTALVGILNAFMENKGLIAPQRWRQFCADRVILGRFSSFVAESGKVFSFGVQIFSDIPMMEKAEVTVRGTIGQSEAFQQKVTFSHWDGRLTEERTVTWMLPGNDQPYVLHIGFSWQNISNEYDVDVFPWAEVCISSDRIEGAGQVCLLCETETQAVQVREQGKAALIVPSREGKLPAEYCTDFWNYRMFSSISRSMGKPEPVGTLGMLIRTEDPLLRGFPSRSYTTPVWYSILQCCHLERTEDCTPALEMIDNPERAQRFGILYRENGQVYCTARLWENANDIAVRWFAYCLVQNLQT